MTKYDLKLRPIHDIFNDFTERFRKMVETFR